MTICAAKRINDGNKVHSGSTRPQNSHGWLSRHDSIGDNDTPVYGQLGEILGGVKVP